MTTDEALDRIRAANCFAQAVRPGGALIVEPWIAPEKFGHDRTNTLNAEVGSMRACRASRGWMEGEISVSEFQWLITKLTPGSVEHFAEQRRCGNVHRDVHRNR